MTKLIELCKRNASLEEIKQDLENNKHIPDYINHTDNNGNTALICAAIDGYIEQKIVFSDPLYNNGYVRKDIVYGNLISHNNINGRIDLIKLFINHEADIHIKNKAGEDAISHARRNNHTEIENEILKRKSQ